MLKIRGLDLAERERYLSEWQAVQSRFVDFPKGAVTEADELVCSFIQTRGYPVIDFDQRAADISVDHPRVVELSFGARHRTTAWQRGSQHGRIHTAMIHYRSLFDEFAMYQRPATKKWHNARYGALRRQDQLPLLTKEEKNVMKPSTDDKTTGKIHEVKGTIKENVGEIPRTPIWKRKANRKERR